MSRHRPPENPKALRVGARLGKYKLTRRLGDGGFARVYAGYDTVEQRHVALKLPTIRTQDQLDDALRECRLVCRFDHPNVLCLRSADFIEDHLVLAFPLGLQSLEDRIRHRIGAKRAFDYAEQLIAGLAHAHEHRVIHRDIKPGNVILFDEHQLRLSDFGVAHASVRTRYGTSVGTVGYMAPEQGLGRSSPRADVFSMGLLLYRISTGRMFEWPFTWPGPGRDRLRKWPAAWGSFLQRCLQVHEHRRFPDAVRMQTAFEAIAPGIRKALNR